MVEIDKYVKYIYSIVTQVTVTTCNYTMAYASDLSNTATTIRKTTNPIIELLASLGYPVTYSMLVVGVIMIITTEDIIALDLSKGFTFDYPELDISTIPHDEEYECNIKRFASDYCILMEKFININNIVDAQQLTANMRNILIVACSACSLTFLAGFTDMYSFGSFKF